MSQINYDHLTALLAVTREGSFEGAARALHITQSAVSQRIKSLEDSMGQLLLVRSAPPRPTQSGQSLIAYANQIEKWESELLFSLRQEESSQQILHTIGVNADSLATWFLDALFPALGKERILVEVLVDDEHFTHELLRRGEVSGCVSAKKSAPLGCESELLGTLKYRCLCTPRFKKRYFPNGLSSEAIASAPTILYSRKDKLHEQFLREKLNWRGDTFPTHLVPSSQGFLSFVRRGLVYGLVPDFQTLPYIQSGKLVELTPGKHAEIDLYWHYMRFLPPYIQQFTTTIIATSKKVLAAGRMR